MLVHGIGVEVSGGLKIGEWWGFCCCCFFILLQRETCLTSEIGEVGIQKKTSHYIILSKYVNAS